MANGSTDPTFGMDFAPQSTDSRSIWVSASAFPLRIFDRNQGEKARTQIDIAHAQRQMRGGAGAGFQRRGFGVLHPVQFGEPVRPTLGPDGYLETAPRVRDTMSFLLPAGTGGTAGLPGCAADYRATEVAYINLVGAYLTAAGQLNMAVGREVLR